jgi:NAD(P)-dependent dehydrogenase (short-subunit alcohol dehydrogenase family)
VLSRAGQRRHHRPQRGLCDETVAELGKQGTAWGITADLADRAQVEAVREQLASGHADATLLVDAAGFFIPKPFLEYDGAFYDPSSTHIHPSHFWRKDEHSDRR